MGFVRVARRLLSWSAVACLTLSGTSFAQTGTAALIGTVSDQQGAVLPGVTVTLTGAESGVVRSTTTDTSGNYQILALQPGAYNLKVELEGFRTAVREKVNLPVDVQTKLDIPMEIGARTETIQDRKSVV